MRRSSGGRDSSMSENDPVRDSRAGVGGEDGTVPVTDEVDSDRWSRSPFTFGERCDSSLGAGSEAVDSGFFTAGSAIPRESSSSSCGIEIADDTRR